MKRSIFVVTIFFGVCLHYSSQNDLRCFKIPDSLGKTQSKIKLSSPCEIKEFDFKIFDNYGSILYSTTTFSTQLDLDIYETTGKRAKPKYPTGTYYWVTKYKTVINGQPTKGNAKGTLIINSD